MAGRMMKIFARAYLCGPELHPEEVKRKFQDANEGFVVQTTKADTTSNELFVEMLAAQTLTAKALGSLLANKPEIDLLLRLAGTTQISRSIKQKGARDGSRFLVVIAGSSEVKEPKALAARRLERRELVRSELSRIETAALLNTKRP